MNANLTNPAGTNAFCLCGCTQPTSGKAFYRPGHDARHVSNLLAALIKQADGKGFSSEMVRQMGKGLPSEALRIKFSTAAHNFANKGQKAKAAKKAQPELIGDDTTGWKIGRWVYPMAVRFDSKHSGIHDGRYDWHYNTKRDGSGEWVSIEGVKGEMVSL